MNACEVYWQITLVSSSFYSWSGLRRPRYARSRPQTLHGLLGMLCFFSLGCQCTKPDRVLIKFMLSVWFYLQMKNADYFSNYVTEDFTTYINRKRKNNCHGNHIEMQAMAEMYNRPVEVYQYGTGELTLQYSVHKIDLRTFHYTCGDACCSYIDA